MRIITLLLVALALGCTKPAVAPEVQIVQGARAIIDTAAALQQMVNVAVEAGMLAPEIGDTITAANEQLLTHGRSLQTLLNQYHVAVTPELKHLSAANIRLELMTVNAILQKFTHLALPAGLAEQVAGLVNSLQAITATLTTELAQGL